LAEQVGLLRAWDLRFSANSVPTSLAVFWGDEARRRVTRMPEVPGMSAEDYRAAPRTRCCNRRDCVWKTCG
jgi:acyl-homoserine-lactone acylase